MQMSSRSIKTLLIRLTILPNPHEIVNQQRTLAHLHFLISLRYLLKKSASCRYVYLLLDIPIWMCYPSFNLIKGGSHGIQNPGMVLVFL